MRRGASWMGTPSIKGRTESTRMALLTFSLTGLSYVSSHLLVLYQSINELFILSFFGWVIFVKKIANASDHA